MKALVYTNPGVLAYREEPDPVAQSAEVAVRIAGSAAPTCTAISATTRDAYPR